MATPEDSIESGGRPTSQQSGLPPVPPDLLEQELQGEIDDIVPSRGYKMLPIVGLGGSAGSIPALQAFFEAMPAEAGLTFVVVMHLSPEHESTLAELLQRTTKMRVTQVTDSSRLESNSVYVIPPGKQLTVLDGRVQVTELNSDRGKRVTVDLFFRSLADTHGAHATAVVLSGADSDGALGIKRIKERGGLTIAQDPHEAEHSGMPRAAIETGMVDWVLKVTEMPERILEYFAIERRLNVPPEEGPQPAKPLPLPPDEAELALRDVLVFLRTRTGRDFSYYKRATILRRIARRMQVNSVADMSAYLAFLRTHPGEAGALLQDLLISVTNFFRDRDAFEALEVQIPDIFKGKGPGDAVRVWVPACATGEEAYSIAILLMEHARRSEGVPNIQIFACDLDEDAIQVARAGIYPESITADVSEERLHRFFLKEHSGYRVRREIREAVLFAAHDLLKDAPFSRMDLISCRNLFIYLNREAQTKVLDIFHFALRPHGRLFLGSSESVDDDSPLFSVLDKKHRIYVSRPAHRVGLPVPSGPSTLARTLQAHEDSKGTPVVHGAGFLHSARAAVAATNTAPSERIPLGELHFKLIERFAPPSVLINQNHEIVHLSENAGQFLQFTGGEITTNLLRVIHPMLRVELRAALFRASETGMPVDVLGVPIELNGVSKVVDIRVAPARELASGFLLVILDIQEPVRPDESAAPQAKSEPVVRHLERELEQMKAHLRDTVEQYEASTEELKASNEELQAMNEELRSATEELETSREELQSINEELTTVNHELKLKVDELGHTNSDLHNLMASTAIATVFLDRDLRITRFTPASVSLFHLIASDIGRPLGDLKYQIEYPNLTADAESVLRTLLPIEREVYGDERWFLARVLPYRTIDDHIAGVVLTFVDITERKRAEAALAASEEWLRLVVESAHDHAIFSTDLERCVTSWNSGAERLLGYAEAEILGQSVDVIFRSEDRAEHIPECEAQNALTHGRASDERWHVRKNGEEFWASGVTTLMRNTRGENVGFVKVLRDQTEQLRAKEAVEQSHAELWAALQETDRARKEAEAAGRAKDHFLAVLSHELRTPLTPVLLSLRMLERRKDLPESVYEILGTLRTNVQLEAALIDDLLDITRISRGKTEIVRKSLDVHEALRKAIEISEPDIAAKNQRLSVTLDASQHVVSGDAKRLQQVFWNLLKNASKFTPHEGEIRVHSRNENEFLMIEVADTGIGFEPEATSRIFKPFEQADESVARMFGGLGLGLAISKATIDAHDGKLHAQSDGPGKGATFTVQLPLKPTDEV